MVPRDHQNTVRDVVDDNGVLRKHVDYDSFVNLGYEQYYYRSGCPIESTGTVELNDFLLTGEREREPVYFREDDSLVVFRLDDELVDALAELDEPRIPEVADEWGISDIPNTIALLSDLRALTTSTSMTPKAT